MANMATSATRKFGLSDLRSARQTGAKVAMLTCYDFTTARLMEEAGVPALLVGDSAASVILGHPSTLPVSLDFMIELCAAVRRGAPNCFLVADMPFGSYQASAATGVKNVCKMMQLSGADCVKLEVASSHARLVRKITDAGVAVMAHLGLRPQAVGLLGGYRAQGRNSHEADEIVRQAEQMQKAGAVAILLEAVPPEVSEAVVNAIALPVIGCGAGPACHGSVVVTQDLLGLTPRQPRFVQPDETVKTKLIDVFENYVSDVSEGRYPGTEHQYRMNEKH
jgi:3-methyl-2-oxobutanoate hydroxymethyltransferase